MQIFFRPVIQANYGCQVLLWNMPGQAFTSTHDSTVLNNEYSANILHELLQKLQGSAEFITYGRPFILLGFGNGANIATYFALNRV
jgi:predicted esterase